MSFPPTLKQLRYLIALKKHMHFGKAADACNVTQSTLSAGLQELEALLGIQLVERTKRSVMFTAHGDEIVQRGQKILSDVDDLTAMAEAAKDPLTGIVRLGIIPTIAPFLLPRVMPAWRDALPNLTLHLYEDKSAQLCERLRGGELDLVLFALPFSCGDVEEMPLFEDPFLAAYPRGSEPGPVISQANLQQTKLMLLEEGHCLRDHALDACQLVGRPAKDALAGTSLHTIVEMVASGHGATLLPSMAIEAGITRPEQISICGFSDMQPSRTIGLIWRPSHPRSETFRALGQSLQDSLCTPYRDGRYHLKPLAA